MKSLILYKTKYGSTKRYAQWLSEILGCGALEMDSADVSSLAQYDTVLLGSPAYIGGLQCRKFVANHWHILHKKRIIIFGVTGITPEDPRHTNILKRSFPEHIIKAISYYPLRGAFSYRQLSWLDKLLMSGPRIRLQIKWWIRRDIKSKELLQRFYSPMDWTSKNAVEVLCRSAGLIK